jgi:hypothetical protein
MDRDEKRAFILGVLSGVTGNAVWQIILSLAGGAVLGGVAGWARGLTDFEQAIFYTLAAVFLARAGVIAFLRYRATLTERRLEKSQPPLSGAKVTMLAEDAPGLAQIRIVNLGEKAIFTASAKVIEISEQVANPQFLQTYALRWGTNGKDEITLGTGAASSLIIATSGETIPRSQVPSNRALCELLLQGFVDGQPSIRDRRRWHEGDKPGAVTVRLEVSVSSSAAAGVVTREFVVTSREWGGLQIKEPAAAMVPFAATPPESDSVTPQGSGATYSAEGVRPTYLTNPRIYKVRLHVEPLIEENAVYLKVHNRGDQVEVYGTIYALAGLDGWPIGRIFAVWEGTEEQKLTIERGELRRLQVARRHTLAGKQYWQFPYFEARGKTSWFRWGFRGPGDVVEILATIVVKHPAPQTIAHTFRFDGELVTSWT